MLKFLLLGIFSSSYLFSVTEDDNKAVNKGGIDKLKEIENDSSVSTSVDLEVKKKKKENVRKPVASRKNSTPSYMVPTAASANKTKGSTLTDKDLNKNVRKPVASRKNSTPSYMVPTAASANKTKTKTSVLTDQALNKNRVGVDRKYQESSSKGSNFTVVDPRVDQSRFAQPTKASLSRQNADNTPVRQRIEINPKGARTNSTLSSKTGAKANPGATPKTGTKANSAASPKTGVRANPAASPKTGVRANPAASPKTGVRDNPAASSKTGVRANLAASPKTRVRAYSNSSSYTESANGLMEGPGNRSAAQASPFTKKASPSDVYGRKAKEEIKLSVPVTRPKEEIVSESKARVTRPKKEIVSESKAHVTRPKEEIVSESKALVKSAKNNAPLVPKKSNHARASTSLNRDSSNSSCSSRSSRKPVRASNMKKQERSVIQIPNFLAEDDYTSNAPKSSVLPHIADVLNSGNASSPVPPLDFSRTNSYYNHKPNISRGRKNSSMAGSKNRVPARTIAKNKDLLDPSESLQITSAAKAQVKNDERNNQKQLMDLAESVKMKEKDDLAKLAKDLRQSVSALAISDSTASSVDSESDSLLSDRPDLKDPKTSRMEISQADSIGNSSLINDQAKEAEQDIAEKRKIAEAEAKVAKKAEERTEKIRASVDDAIKVDTSLRMDNLSFGIGGIYTYEFGLFEDIVYLTGDVGGIVGVQNKKTFIHPFILGSATFKNFKYLNIGVNLGFDWFLQKNEFSKMTNNVRFSVLGVMNDIVEELFECTILYNCRLGFEVSLDGHLYIRGIFDCFTFNCCIY